MLNFQEKEQVLPLLFTVQDLVAVLVGLPLSLEKVIVEKVVKERQKKAHKHLEKEPHEKVAILILMEEVDKLKVLESVMKLEKSNIEKELVNTERVKV